MRPTSVFQTLLRNCVLLSTWAAVGTVPAAVSVSVEFEPSVISFSPLDPPVYIFAVSINATGFTDDANTDNFVEIHSSDDSFSSDFYPARGTGSGTAGSIGTSSPGQLSDTINAGSLWTLTLTDGVTHTVRQYTLNVSTPGIAPDYIRPIALDTNPDTVITTQPVFGFTQPATALPSAQDTYGFAFMIGNLPNNYPSGPALLPTDTSWAPDGPLTPDTYVVVVAKGNDSPDQSIVATTAPVPVGGAPALALFTRHVKTQSSAQSGGLSVPGGSTNYDVSMRLQPAVISFSPLDPPVYIMGIGLSVSGFADDSNTDNFIEVHSADDSFSGDLYPARGTGSGTAGSVGISSTAELSALINSESSWTMTITDGVTHSVSTYSLVTTTPGIDPEYVRPITLDTNPGATISATPTFHFTQPSTTIPDAQSTSGFAFMIGNLPGNYATSPGLQANDTSWGPDSALIPDTYVVVVAKVNDSPSQTLIGVTTPVPQGSASPLASFSHSISIQCEADSSGLIVHAGCPADLANGSGVGIPDGGVDINDLLFFLTHFEAGDVASDIDDGSGTGTPDGGVDINDLLFFLNHFEQGC